MTDPAKKRVPAGAAVLRADVTESIRSAVFAELAAGGYGRLSIEGVARRAGVGKMAVYRRWPSKLEMVIDLVGSVAVDVTVLPDLGSLRADLEFLGNLAARALRHPLANQIVPDLLAEAARTPAIADTLRTALRTHQREAGELLTGRAIARGELPAGHDPELLIDLLIGPLYWRLAVTRTPVPKGYVAKVAELITNR